MGMMINRRRVMDGKKGLLPSGYTQLEYIENTSNAYIYTGIDLSVLDRMEVVFSWNNNAGGVIVCSQKDE